jgi:hypothetical protein
MFNIEIRRATASLYNECIVSNPPVKQRSVLRRLVSNNDDLNMNRGYFYTKQKEGEREQDVGETERESV